MENKNISKVKRGEIYLYDFGTNEGSIQNGLRPALVVQCDEGNKASCTTVIAATTTVIKKRYLPSHIILGDRFGLKEPSMVMLETEGRSTTVITSTLPSRPSWMS